MIGRRIEGADLYCGAGGSTTGMLKALKALGYDVDVIAVNHWEVAIATHSANHPGVRHACTDLNTTRPTELVPSGHLDILWASPTCTHHSRALGAKPINDQQRMDPWAVHRWLTELDVERVIVENVPEFVEWGPLDAAQRPNKKRKGEYFQTWVKSLWLLGYDVEWKLLNAADYGEATTRTRFFLQGRKRGMGIVWPNATHCKRGSKELFGGRQPWRGAVEVLDLQDSGASIFKAGKEGPQGKNGLLAVNTRKRMARGFERFSDPLLSPLFIDLLDLPAEDRARFIPTPKFEGPIPRIYTGQALAEAKPFILANRAHNAPKSEDEPIPGLTTANGGGITLTTPFVLAQGGGGSPRPMSEPMPTIVSKGAISAVQPTLVQYNGKSEAQSIDDPLGAVTTRDRFGLASPVVVNLRGTNPSAIDTTASSVDDPLQPITTYPHHYLASPMLVNLRGTEQSHLDASAAPVDEPVRTITSGGHHGLVTPMVQSAGGPDVEARPVDEPLPTILTKDRLALATPFITPGFGEKEGQAPRLHSIDDPVPTVTAQGHHHLVSPMVVDYYGREDTAHPIDVPLTTVTAGGRRHSLVNPVVVTMSQTSRTDDGTVRSEDEPLPTLTARNNLALGMPILQEPWPWPEIPADLDPRRLLYIDDVLHLLDIHFRMLKPKRELSRAMGFPDDYVFVGTQEAVTKQIGNAVSRRTAEALVAAAFSELAGAEDVA